MSPANRIQIFIFWWVIVPILILLISLCCCVRPSEPKLGEGSTETTPLPETE